MEKYLANCFDYQKFENHAGLQAVINEQYGNGDVHNDELAKAVMNYTVTDSRTAWDAAYDLAVGVLNKPYNAVRLGGESAEAVAERLASDVVGFAETHLDAVEDAELRRAKSYLHDVLFEARDQIGDIIEVPGSGVVFADAPVGTEHVESIEYADTGVRDGNGYHVSDFRTDNGLLVKDLDTYSDVYALTIAVREAQIRDIVQTLDGSEINFDEPLAVSRDDNDTDMDYIARVAIDDNGILNISGHRLNDEGETEVFYHADMLYLNGFEELLAAVKDVSLRQQREPVLARVGAISDIGNKPYQPEESAIVRDAAVAYLAKYNDDYYQAKGVDIAAVFAGSDITDRKALRDVAAAVAYDIQSEALRGDWNILRRYLPEGTSREQSLAQLSSEIVKHAESIVDLRQNNLSAVIDERVGRVNAMLTEFNRLSASADPEYMLHKHVESYTVEHQQENEFALAD